MTVYNKEQ